MENNITKDWANFTNGSCTPPVIWRRFEKGSDRFYFSKLNEQIETAIGITTAISRVSGESFHLSKWKDETPNWKELLKKSSEYGTLLHRAFEALLVHGEVPMDLVLLVEPDKQNQFQRDIFCLIKFIDDHKVTAHFVEGILAKKYTDKIGKKHFICSTIDLFCEISIFEKTKVSVEDGIYVRGEKKGETKYKEVTEVTEVRIMAIIDLKSNYMDKLSKSFFDSHRDQLFFGRDLIQEQFGYKDVRMFNLSPLNYKDEPKFTLKEWEDTPNEYGFSGLDILHSKINLGIVTGVFELTGNVFIPGAMKLGSKDYKFLTYKELAENILNELNQQKNGNIEN